MVAFGRSILTPIGLDIGDRRVKAVQLRHARTGPEPAAWATFLRTRPGEPLDAEEAGEIATVLARRGMVGRRVVLAAPADALRHAVVELPAHAAPDAVAAIAAAQTARVHGLKPGGFEVAGHGLPAAAAVRGQQSRRAMVYALDHDAAERVLDAVSAAGLDPVAMDADERSLARAVAAQADTPVVVDLAWMSARIIVTRQGQVVYQRRLSEAGMSAVHEPLRQRLGLDDAALANALDAGDDARGIAAFPLAGRGALRKHIDMLTGEVQASIDYVRREFPDLAVDALILTGGGSTAPGLVDALASATRLEPTRFAPMGNDEAHWGRFAVAWGLATYPREGWG